MGITESEYTSMKRLFVGLNAASTVVLLPLVVYHLTKPQKKAFPARLPLCFQICAVLFHGSLWFSVLTDFDVVTSPDQHALCAVQGALFQFSASGLVLWWFCITVNTFRLCRGHTSQQLQSSEPFYHIAAWGIPAVTTLITLVADVTGKEQGALYCWIDPKRSGLYKFLLFYGYSGLFMVMGAVYGSLIVSFLCSRKKQQTVLRQRLRSPSDGSSRSQSWSTVAASVQASRQRFNYFIARQLMFLYVYLGRFGVFWYWQLNYVEFLRHRTDISYASSVLVLFFVTTIGIDVFLLFGLTADNMASCRKCCRQVLYRHSEGEVAVLLPSGDGSWQGHSKPLDPEAPQQL